MSIHDEFVRQCATLTQTGFLPKRVVFSPEGELIARYERGADFAGSPASGKPLTHYMGLPYEVDPGQRVAIVVKSEEATKPPVAISFRVNHLNPHQTTMQVAGQGLSKTQLCDLVIAWSEANPFDVLGAALRNVVVQRGRFE